MVNDHIKRVEPLRPRLRHVNAYLKDSGYRGGYPNMKDATDSVVPVYGVIAIKQEAAEYFNAKLDISYDKSDRDIWRKVHRWCKGNESKEYASGFPNMETYSGHYGVIAIKKAMAKSFDPTESELSVQHNPSDNELLQAAHDWCRSKSDTGGERLYVSGFPNFEQLADANGRVHRGIICLKPEAAKVVAVDAVSLVAK